MLAHQGQGVAEKGIFFQYENEAMLDLGLWLPHFDSSTLLGLNET